MRTVIAIATLFLMSSSSLAKGPKLHGHFYYDRATNRYFTTDRSAFSIRPVEDPKYLDRIEISIDNGEFTKYSSKVRFDKEGLHIIRFRAADPVLNWSPMQYFRLYVDVKAPKSYPFWEGATFEDKGKLFVHPTARLSINAQDGLSGISKILWQRDAKTTKTFPTKASFKKEGEYKVRFSSVDRVGNQEPWFDVPFSVDASAPKTKAAVQGFSYPTKTGLFVNSSSVIDLVSEDRGSGVKAIQYQINGGPITEYKQALAPIGKKFSLKYRGVDQVGNKEKWKTITVLQDTTPPRLSVKRKGRHLYVTGKLYARPGFSVQASASDSESGLKQFLVTRDGSNFTPVKDGKFRFDKPGEYYFVVRAIDQVGNLEESNPYQVVIDASAPESKLEASHKLVESGNLFISGVPNRIEFDSKDSGVGVDRVEFSFDGKSFKRVPGYIDLAEWKIAKRTIFYRAVDRLGNKEKTKQMSIHVRTSGPKVDLFVETENYPDVPLSTLKNRGSASLKKARTPAASSPKKKPVRKKKRGKRKKR